MSTVAFTPELRAFASRRREALLPFLLLAVAMGIYLTFRWFFDVASSTPVRATGATVLAVAVALPFVKLRYQDLPRFTGIFIRWIGVTVLVQVVLDALAFTPGVPSVLFGGGPTVIFFRFAALIAIASGVFGWWRPAFLLPVFAFYDMFRELINSTSGIVVVKTDYRSMLDTGSFALIGTVAIIAICSPWVASRVPRIAKWHERLDVPELQKSSILLVWCGAVGAHLANYFYSGLSKLEAGWPEPWTWVLHNPTQTSILMGLERGDNLLWAFPGILNLIWQAFVHFGVILNAIVICTQLASPAAAVGRRTLLTFTVFFDMFHVAVWFTLGAIFQYWVIVNVLIFASAQHLGIKRFTTQMRIVMAGMTLMAPTFFYVNHLGWLDGPKIPSPKFIAHTRDGRSVEMPGPYFGIFSYNIAQNFLWIPDGAFANYPAGNHHHLASWRDAIKCGPLRAEKQNVRRQHSTLQSVVAMVENTDRFARSHPWYKSLNIYYFYPQHMLPNPAMFKDFNRLSINDIVGYTYRVDSVCLDLRNGVLHRDVRDVWEYPIPVPGAAPALSR